AGADRLVPRLPDDKVMPALAVALAGRQRLAVGAERGTPDVLPPLGREGTLQPRLRVVPGRPRRVGPGRAGPRRPPARVALELERVEHPGNIRRLGPVPEAAGRQHIEVFLDQVDADEQLALTVAIEEIFAPGVAVDVHVALLLQDAVPQVLDQPAP